MKKTAVCKHCIRLLVCCCLVSFVNGQDTPVQWKAVAGKVNDSVYKLQVTGTIKEGWYVYAAADERFGLEPITVNWNDSRIKAMSTAEVQQLPVTVPDKIFNAKLPVYPGTIELEQQLKISGNISAARISITCFAAKDKTFLPLETTLDGKVTITARHTIAEGLTVSDGTTGF